jgi:Glycosyl hydrolase family 79 C-terminal beta domain
VNRRHFIEGFMGFFAVPLSGVAPGLAQRATTKAIRVTIDTRRKQGRIPDDFTGLGYEISSVAMPGLLSDKNRAYVRLVRGLGANGVIRVGGITSDSASFAVDAVTSAAAKATVINAANLRELGAFLDATGWRLIWGLNLGSGDMKNAAEEAVAVTAAVKDKLLAFEIGNEPDGFAGDAFNSHRPKNYGYGDYLKEFRAYKAAIRSKLPEAPFAGPDASWATDWVSRFAADEGSDLKLLTRHYYRAGANNPYLDKLIGSESDTAPGQRAEYEARSKNNKIDLLMREDPSIRGMLQELSAAASAAHVPFRICEANSFYGGGQPGVSDAFVSALWVLDFMWTLAYGGAAGVNMQTGINHLDFVSYYSAIRNDAKGAISIGPEYYGMLAFAQAGKGERIALDYDADGMNLAAYAVLGDHGHLMVTLINKDPYAAADITMTTGRTFQKATALRLKGHALDSADNVTLGGSEVAADGSWKPTEVVSPHAVHGVCEIHVPAASAAIVKWNA